jgi:hypothetical protein
MVKDEMPFEDMVFNTRPVYVITLSQENHKKAFTL